MLKALKNRTSGTGIRKTIMEFLRDSLIFAYSLQSFNNFNIVIMAQQ